MRYSDAIWSPAGTPGGVISPRVLILHTEATVGQAQPHSGLEWHFMVMNDGTVKQLVDTNRRADANNRANTFAISVETEDDGSPDADKWTPQQVKAIVKLCRWANATHGIPLRRCNAWDGSGIGYHTMWGAPSEWTPVAKTCPGAARKAQFEAEILPLLTAPIIPPPAPPTDEDDMPYQLVQDSNGARVTNLGKGNIFMVTPKGLVKVVDPGNLTALRSAKIAEANNPTLLTHDQIVAWA